jgi:hypothetical protein
MAAAMAEVMAAVTVDITKNKSFLQKKHLPFSMVTSPGIIYRRRIVLS